MLTDRRTGCMEQAPPEENKRNQIRIEELQFRFMMRTFPKQIPWEVVKCDSKRSHYKEKEETQRSQKKVNPIQASEEKGQTFWNLMDSWKGVTDFKWKSSQDSKNQFVGEEKSGHTAKCHGFN